MSAPVAAPTPSVANPATPAPATPESAAPAQPAFDQRQVQQWQQDAQNFQQLQRELTQLAAQQQRQQDEQRATEAAQNRLNQVYQIAENMEPQQALAYIRTQEQQERAALQGEIRRIQEQGEQRVYQAVAQVAAPLYAQEIAKREGLPPEYAERLAMLPPQQMDVYLPVLKREHEAQKATQTQLNGLIAQLDQLQRSQGAQQVAATGAHMGGGAGVSPVVADANGRQLERGSREHLLSLPGVAQLFGS